MSHVFVYVFCWYPCCSVCVSVPSVSTCMCLCRGFVCSNPVSPFFFLFNPSFSWRFLWASVCAMCLLLLLLCSCSFVWQSLVEIFSSVFFFIFPSLKNQKQNKNNNGVCVRPTDVELLRPFLNSNPCFKNETSKKFVVKCVLLICFACEFRSVYPHARVWVSAQCCTISNVLVREGVGNGGGGECVCCCCTAGVSVNVNVRTLEAVTLCQHRKCASCVLIRLFVAVAMFVSGGKNSN